MAWTKKHLDKLVASGRVRSYAAIPAPKNKIPIKGSSTETGPKIGLKMSLAAFCQNRGLPLFEEQPFHETRKWRFDWLIPGRRPVAIEYEGIFSAAAHKNGHQHQEGYAKDVEKYRTANLQGIIVLRYTARDAKNIVNDLNFIYAT